MREQTHDRRNAVTQVSGHHAHLAWYRFRREFAHRWAGYVGLVVLVALVGGISLASIAGARTT